MQSEDYTKDAQLFQQPLPSTDSPDAIILDLFGAIGTFTIKGVFTSSISTNITFLKGLINGAQSRIAYVSDISGTFNVYVQNVEWSIEEGAGGQKLNYTISLIEGAA